MDKYGSGDDIPMGIMPRESAEHFDPNGSTIIVKREYYCKDDEDFVDVNGPFLCIKKEKDDIDHPILLTNDVDTSRIFEVKPLDPEMVGAEQQIGTNGELLVVWQERESSAERSSERLWVRKDPQCEVWSCKMSATYGHSTGPSRCSQHREAWMVMFGHCAIDGCTKFGVVVSSDDEPIKCEAHAATLEENAVRPKQASRPLEHLVGLNGVGPSGLGLGLGLGDDSRLHEVSSRSQVLDSGPVLGENFGGVQDGQRVTEVGIAPSCSNHSSPRELNGATTVSVEAEISRLREEHDGLRQRMVQIEIELARLEGSRNRDAQVQEAPVKRAAQQRPRQVAQGQETVASKVPAAVNDGKNGTSPSNPQGKISLDGYNWRKYGEMTLPGHNHPRVFYGCTNIGCIARKIEERTEEGNVRHFYEGVHNHPQPGKSFPRPVSIPHWKRRKRHHSVCTD